MNNDYTETITKQVEKAHSSIPSASEQALRASESALRARIVTVTHEMQYLLLARDLWLMEHEKLLFRLENLGSTADL